MGEFINHGMWGCALDMEIQPSGNPTWSWRNPWNLLEGIWRAPINCDVIPPGSPFISACFPTFVSDIHISIG